MRRKHSITWLVLVIFVGAIMGSALGKVIALIVPKGVVQEFFLRSISFGFSPVTFDLSLLQFTFGLSFQLNVIGVLGILLAVYILRWYT
jgi:hypothetical protein